MNDLPRKLRSGEPIPEARWWNKLIDAIEARTMLPAPDYLLKKGKTGTSLKLKTKTAAGGGAVMYASCLTPKEFITSSDLAVSVKVVFHPCEMRACGVNEAIKMHPVNYGAEVLLPDPPPWETPEIGDPTTYPEIELVDGENKIYAEWETDVNGTIEDDSVELTLTLPTGSQVHIPDSPSGSGTTGKYYQLCGIINVPEPEVGATVRSGTPTWVPVADHLSWEAFSRDISNVGSQKEVAKAITETAAEFRTLNAKTESISETNEWTGELSLEQKTDTIEFSSKLQLPGSTGTGIFRDCDDTVVHTVSWTKGLITSGSFDVTLGDCETDISPP